MPRNSPTRSVAEIRCELALGWSGDEEGEQWRIDCALLLAELDAAMKTLDEITADPRLPADLRRLGEVEGRAMSKDSPFLTPPIPMNCGCRFADITKAGAGFGTLEFQFCPMHRAAPAMLKALRPFAESTAWEHLDPRRQAARTGTEIDAYNRLAAPFRQARVAVAKAEGREE